MLPRLIPGKIVLACGLGRLKIGDVVILTHDGLEKIKRIARIDGNQLYVLGDNSAESSDSRQFGAVNRAYVIARVIWPRA